VPSLNITALVQVLRGMVAGVCSDLHCFVKRRDFFIVINTNDVTEEQNELEEQGRKGKVQVKV